MCIREKQLAVLSLEYPEVDWGDVVDERVLTSSGLRRLGSLKYKIPGAKDRTDSQTAGGGHRRRLLRAMPDRH